MNELYGEKEKRPTGEKAPDLLHMGNYDGALLQDATKSRNEYNDQLIKQNSKFSQLVGKLHSNVQSVDAILAELPTTEMLNKLQQQIYTFIGVQN